DILGHGFADDPSTKVFRHRGDRIDVVRIERSDFRAHRRACLQRVEEHLEGLRGDHETRRHGNAGLRQLAKRSTFSAHREPVADADILEPGDRRDHASSSAGSSTRMVTVPRPPSTRIRWPSLMRVVAEPVPTAAGSPYSRATIAMWLIEPPM